MNASTNTIGSNITAIILAGGASSRMNQPKALLPWRGQRFIDHVVAQLHDQAIIIAISSNQAELFESLQLPILADPFSERRGPLAGMLAGLRFSTTPFTLFVPCDSPLISPQLGARLQRALTDQAADIAYATSGGDAHYLFALLRSDLHSLLAAYLDRGDYAVRRWFGTLNSIAVDFDDDARYFLNVNTPADLQRLE
ncbi:MAG: molybdenum cofactor guanylyltransferase MobA [Spongiibacteraceae bacterium]